LRKIEEAQRTEERKKEGPLKGVDYLSRERVQRETRGIFANKGGSFRKDVCSALATGFDLYKSL